MIRKLLVAAIVAALFLAKPKQTVAWAQTGAVTTQPDAEDSAAPSAPDQELAATDHHGKHAGA